VGLPPPKSIEVGPPNATREQGVLGVVSKGVPALKVAKPTEVTLEGGE